MKLIALLLLLLTLPLILVVYLAVFVLWYPVAALLRFAERDVPYPHEYMESFVKGELAHAH
jgi:hypothetical protein